MRVNIIHFENNNETLEDALENIQRRDLIKLKAEIINTGLYVERKAKENLKKNGNVKHGTLRRSIASNKDGDYSVVIGTNVEYASYIEYGTREHVIRPKNKKALKWKDGGAYHFAKSVKHPGTRPYPFLEPALEEGVKYLEKKINKIYESED